MTLEWGQSDLFPRHTYDYLTHTATPTHPKPKSKPSPDPIPNPNPYLVQWSPSEVDFPMKSGEGAPLPCRAHDDLSQQCGVVQDQSLTRCQVRNAVGWGWGLWSAHDDLRWQWSGWGSDLCLKFSPTWSLPTCRFGVKKRQKWASGQPPTPITAGTLTRDPNPHTHPPRIRG